MPRFSSIKASLKIAGILFFYVTIFFYAVIFDNSTGWILFFFLTFLILVDLISLLPSFKKMNCEVTESKTYEVGHSNLLLLDIFCYRQTWLPLPKVTLQLTKEEDALSATLLLYSGNKEGITLPWLPSKRGVFRKLPLFFTAQDLFGFFSKNGYLVIEEPIIVLPQQQLALAEAIYQQLAQVHPTFVTSFGERGFSIRNFRQYQANDSLNQIDWKQSGKRNELIVKEFESEAEATLHFIFYGASHQKFEAILSVYYSFRQLVTAKLDYKETVLANYPPEIQGHSQELFASLTPLAENKPLPSLSRKKIIVFAPSHTKNLNEHLINLRRTNEVCLVIFKKEQLYLVWNEQITPISAGGEPHEK